MRVGAIDQGTSSTRILVVDGNGHGDVLCSQLHNQAYPAPGWVEQDGLQILRNVRTCIAAAGKLDALGLANQGESCLAWDAVTREPLSPILTWQDTRSSRIVETMRAEGQEAVTRERAGLPLSPYFSAGKLSWLMANVPAVVEARRRGRLRLGTTDAFLLQHLTGECATDVSTASRTCLLNLKTCEWDPLLCDLFQLPIESLPPIRSTVGGFGSFENTPVSASIVDQQASLFGHGCRQPGEAKITFGTGAFLLAIAGEQPIFSATGLIPTVAWQLGQTTTFAIEGGVFHAGSAVAWARNLGLDCRLDHMPQAATTAIERKLIFVPALSGLGAPHWDPSASAVWIGMDATTSVHDLCQSVLEGVALRTVEVISRLESSLHTTAALSIDGGMAANRYFVQFLADASGRSILAHPGSELTALGCARLAALGAGLSLQDTPASTVLYTPAKKDRALWMENFQQALELSRHGPLLGPH